MAKKLKQSENADTKPVSLSNFKGYDGGALMAHINEVVGLVDKAKEDSQPVKDKKAELKAEHGYHMKAFGNIMGVARSDKLEQVDWWRTIKAWATANGLDDPDLVDKMTEAA